MGPSTHDRNSREEEKEKGIENLFEEVMAENFANLKDTDTKIQESQRAPNKLNSKQDNTKTYYNKNGKS